MNPVRRREMVDREHPSLPIVGQCALLGVSRSSIYYRPKGASEEDLSLMREIDRQYLATPFYGSRRMKVWLERQGILVSRKRVQRLMRVMGLRAIYRRPRTSRPAQGVRVYPYLLGKAEITRPNQVCALLGISRSSLYYLPTEAGAEDLELMALIDQQYLKTPFYGSRRMTAWLRNHGHQVNRKRVRRLMQLIGLEAIYRRPNTSKPNPGHKVYPYLLRGLEINRVNQVWATDITYIPMARGFLYLVAIIDWHSRYVLAWRLSNTLEVDFCVAALEEALSKGRPQIFNTDQGSQFTSEAFTSMLLAQGVQVSMDGRGRCMDNVFVERLWRSIKYEEVYLKAYQNGTEARKGIGAYLSPSQKSDVLKVVDFRVSSSADMTIFSDVFSS